MTQVILREKQTNVNNGNIGPFLQSLEELVSLPDWNKEVTIFRLASLMRSQQRLILSQTEGVEAQGLQDKLIKLSQRIDRHFSTPESHELSFKMMGMARGLFNLGEKPDWALLPRDLVLEILSHVPPHSFEAKESGLKSIASVSKGLQQLAAAAECNWINKETISLKIYCKTAQEAVQFAIEHQLKSVNLADFPDLEDGDLDKLFGHSSPENLLINSKKISKIPTSASCLKTLTCDKCSEIQNFPVLPRLQKLSCSYSFYNTSLPDLPKLEELNCYRSGIKVLPALPKLKKLFCGDCQLTSIPASLQLLELLDCTDCRFITSLPLLPGLKSLICFHITISYLPHFPQLRRLHCGWNKNLTSLPHFPLLEFLSCSNCPIDTLPELPELKKLYIKACPLSSLPEFPELLWLEISNCNHFYDLLTIPKLQHLTLYELSCLTSLSELPLLQELDFQETPLLKNLPAEFPMLKKLNCSGSFLRLLPRLPQLIALYCRGCRRLTGLPEMPALEELDCLGCKRLRQLPPLPRLARLLCSGCGFCEDVNLPVPAACHIKR